MKTKNTNQDILKQFVVMVEIGGGGGTVSARASDATKALNALLAERDALVAVAEAADRLRLNPRPLGNSRSLSAFQIACKQSEYEAAVKEYDRALANLAVVREGGAK